MVAGADAGVHPDVASACAALGHDPSRLSPEPDNRAHGGAIARTPESAVRFRVGKVTPTKVGHFVTVWRRAADGSTEPFPAEDAVETLVVAVRDGPNFGAFVFPASALIEHGIASAGGIGGKRGFRVYPPWAAAANPQARRTQQWQIGFFVALDRLKP
ncbi:MepB family protein [Leucobacter sp. cx-169]|uniref:MepB family protein n=1 Tax=Leucobacter sp. cx-169 TaxID=2770549 RepID=UPI00165DA13A|nr:MepB family protein [Leucobacter sp. cx-169]